MANNLEQTTTEQTNAGSNRLSTAMPGIDHFILFYYEKRRSNGTQNEAYPLEERGLAVYDTNKRELHHIQPIIYPTGEKRFKSDMIALRQLLNATDHLIIYDGHPITATLGMGKIVTYKSPNITHEQISQGLSQI